MNILNFEKELEKLINKHSIENGSDTPDFLLTKYLMGCLHNYNSATNARDKYLTGDCHKGCMNINDRDAEEKMRSEIEHIVHPLLEDPMDMKGMYAATDKIMKVFEKYYKT